jgi:hypothetical protein
MPSPLWKRDLVKGQRTQKDAPMERYTTPNHAQITVNFKCVEFVSVGFDGQAAIHFVSGAVRTVAEPHELVVEAFERSLR